MDIFSKDLNVMMRRGIYQAAELCSLLRKNNIKENIKRYENKAYAYTLKEIIEEYENTAKSLHKKCKEKDTKESELKEVLDLIVDIYAFSEIVPEQDRGSNERFNTLIESTKSAMYCTARRLVEDAFIKKCFKYDENKGEKSLISGYFLNGWFKGYTIIEGCVSADNYKNTMIFQRKVMNVYEKISDCLEKNAVENNI